MRIAHAFAHAGDHGQLSVPWSRVAAAATAPAVAKALQQCWPAPAGVILVRYGAPPAPGRSQNYVDGHREAGVSVYRAALRQGRIDILAQGLELRSTRLKAERARRHGKPLYRCVGLCLARGSDNEPVLRVSEVTRLCDLGEAELRVLARHPKPCDARHRRLWRRWQRLTAEPARPARD